MALSPLHIVFNPSAAFSLREALKETGQRTRVISLFDDLSYGPIDPPDPAARAAWIERKLGYTDLDDMFRRDAEFWALSLAPGRRKIVWVSRRSAPEYAGFLEWISRAGDLDFEVIDVTDTAPMGFGCITTRSIVDGRLWEQVRLMTPAARARHRERWRQLRTENAPLRLIRNRRLVSAPLTAYDALLFSLTNNRWRKVARIVGDAMTRFQARGLMQAGDLLLSARIRALVDARWFDGAGDLYRMGRSEIRRSQW